MENKNNEMSPQELLKKLKESIAEDKQHTKQGLSDAARSDEILLHNDEDEQTLFAKQPIQNTVRYRYTVTRPAADVMLEAYETEDESEAIAAEQAEAPVFPLKTDTALSFEAQAGRDMQEVMGAVLSEDEIAQMEQFGAMPDMQTIADEARAEAQQAYERGETADSLDVDSLDVDASDEDNDNEEMTLTDEVEAVYGDAAAYYDTIDAEQIEEDEDVLLTLASEDDELPIETEETEEEQPEAYIQPNETSKRNVFNFIASLTKRAAKSADAEATAAVQTVSAAESVAVAEAAGVSTGLSEDLSTEKAPTADEVPAAPIVEDKQAPVENEPSANDQQIAAGQTAA